MTQASCTQCGTPLDATAMPGLCPQCVALDVFTPEPAASGIPVPPEQIHYVGDYEILELIARGGMGVVYKARQVSLGRTVAIKMIADGVLAGDEAIARFKAEAAAAAGLRHPNIVAIHEIGEHQGRHYFSMEFVAGESLSSCTRDGPLVAMRAGRYVCEVAEAAHYAHEHGVLHRDLKPSNILIDEQDVPRVTDFGLAKRLGDNSELTLSGQILGTPAFMPPEQAEPKRGGVGPRSDVYSLGAILYQLITARAPFTGESPAEILAQVLDAEPVAPRLLNPGLPRDLETICLKCLEKEPSRRYASADELAEDLGRFLGGEPIHARPVMPVERAWRWCKRKPALAASLIGIALLLLGIAVVSNVAARRIEVLRLDALTNLYASDMRLAQQAIAESKFGAAAELLERHQLKTGDPDLRGFEWRHFQERCRSDETASLEPHSNQVVRAAFSPDGRLFATGAIHVQVWESATRRLVFRLPLKYYVWALAFSPDGRELLVGDSGNNVFRFDVAPPQTPPVAGILPGRLLGSLTNLGSRPISIFWPVGEPGVRIVLYDGLLAWDGTSRKAERVASLGSVFSRSQVSPDGRLAGVLNGPNRVGAWRLNPPSLLKEFQQPVLSRAVAISPDGGRLAAGDYSGTVRTWELNTKGRTNVIPAHRGLIEALVFSPDGARLASAGADQIIRLHDAASGAALGEWQGHRGTIMALAFSPDGRWLVSGDKQGRVKLWDLSARPRMPSPALNSGMFLSADGSRAVSWGGGSSLVVHASSALHEPGRTLPAPGQSWILPSARALVVIDPAGKLQSLETNGTWREHSLEGMVAVPGGVLSPDGRFAALRVKGVSGPFVWDLAAGHAVLRITNEQTWLSPTFDAASGRLAYGTASGRVHIWALPAGREVASFLAHHHNYAYACDLSPDGQRLATAGFDGLVRLWEINGARLLGEFRSPADAYWTVALSPDGRRIAAGTSESSIVLWDVPSGQEVATFQLDEPLGPVEGTLRFAPDGTALLHANGALHLWTAPPLAKP